MNAVSMKLENRQPPSSVNKDRSSISLLGKKCKGNRKKSIPVNTDQDALQKNHGLRCPSGGNIELNEINTNDPLDNNASKKHRSKKVSANVNDKFHPKSETMQERLEQFLSNETRENVSKILSDVQSLSDIEKLYLYLQLPTGTPLGTDLSKLKCQNPLGKKADEEGLIAVTWIQSHFEEDPDVSLPKQEVYNEYQAYCQMTGTDCLCAADFGKVMKQIFPSVKPRRLGTRGNSRYCYSGLRKKLQLKPPTLCDIQAETEAVDTGGGNNSMTSAACSIVFQWAEKLLNVKFESLKSLATHLLENTYVDNRSVAAFTVLLEESPQLLERSVDGMKKSDAQFDLQRKIHQKELIKEQKKKLAEQRLTLTKGKVPKKKGAKSKKNKQLAQVGLTIKDDKLSDIHLIKSSEGSSDSTLVQENIQIKEECVELNDSAISSPSVGPPAPTESETVKSFVLSQTTSTPVCIASNILIVPSLQQKSSSKYKRIQPKPLLSSVVRSRTGSVGSAHKPSKVTEGRRSSHAWLPSSPEGTEVNILTTPPLPKGSRRNSFAAPIEVTKNLFASTEYKGANNEGSNLISELILNLNSSSSLPLGHDAVKRHIDEEMEEACASKRPHMDAAQSLISVLGTSKEIDDNALQKAASEEVSVHDIEGDALIDYLRGTTTIQNCLSSAEKTESMGQFTSNSRKVKQLSQLRMLLEQNLPRRSSSVSTGFKDLLQISASSESGTVDTYTENKVLSADAQINEMTSNCFPELNLVSGQMNCEKLNPNMNTQTNVIDKLISDLTLQANAQDQNEFLTDPCIFLNSTKQDALRMAVNLQNNDELKQNFGTNGDMFVASSMQSDISNPISSQSFHSSRVSTYTQVPSVPQSPNTRRRAFNFMPISPRHTPIPDNMTINVSSPIPSQYPRNMMSVGVGPSQPPSNSGSPFVSPRSTPVSMCRSRHSSGQSTSRHTPFQNFDSGVSSISSSPFISPQPTPIPVSRLRHNSSHGGACKTVTFCSVNNPQIINSQTSLSSLRARHSSGPYMSTGVPLSPLVANEHGLPSHFIFPSSNNEIRSRHNSGSTSTTPLSPVSEQTSSSSSCTSNLPDLSSVAENSSFLTDGAGDLLLCGGGSSNFRQVRQRHASSSVIYTKPHNLLKDNFLSPEIQNLLRNSDTNTLTSLSRSQSVPLHQMMLQNLDSIFQQTSSTISHPEEPKPSMFSFDEGHTDKPAGSQMEWALDGRMEPPLSDDLQTTLEDLRDCDTDFSKFAQELEMGHTEDLT